MLPLTELGNRLKEAREAKGLSLDDLQEITKIQKRYLAGIEQGKYEAIPGKFYVRAFIKQYAEAVDLDPESLFEEFRHEIPTVHEESTSEQLSRTQSRAKVAKDSSKFMDKLPKILTALLIIAIIVIGWYFFTKSMDNKNVANSQDEVQSPSVSYNEVGEPMGSENKNTTEDESDESKSESKTENENSSNEELEKENKTVTQQISVVTTEGTTTTYELSNADKFELEVKVAPGGESWVEIYNVEKEKQFFKEIITEANPQTYDLTEENGARLRIGATGVTEIFINGEKLEYAIDATVQNIIIQYKKDEEQ